MFFGLTDVVILMTDTVSRLDRLTEVFWYDRRRYSDDRQRFSACKSADVFFGMTDVVILMNDSVSQLDRLTDVFFCITDIVILMTDTVSRLASLPTCVSE